MDYSTIKRAGLDAMQSELLAILAHLGWPLAETSNLSPEATHELGNATRRVRAQLTAINNELAIRDRMMPTQIAS